MRGSVIKMIRDRGFAFVRGEDGISRFVHIHDVIPKSSFDFMDEGHVLEFLPIETEKGHRAIEVRVVHLDPSDKP